MTEPRENPDPPRHTGSSPHRGVPRPGWLRRLPAATVRRLPAMTLRRRLVVAFAGLVTIAVTLVGGISYSATVSAFYTEMDRTLLAAATALAGGGAPSTLPPPVPPPGTRHGDDGDIGDIGDDATISLVQHIDPTGAISVIEGTVGALPIDARQRRLASASEVGAGRFDTRTVDSGSYRVYTLALGNGRGADVVGLHLGEASRVLTRVAVDTAVIGLGVILLAALAGWWIARQITRRLAALSRAAESVASTGDLSVPIEAAGRDEVGLLAASLRSMLAQLGQAHDAQRRLVEDAGHELRTPITSLRTNASVVRRFDDLSGGDRTRLLDDVDGELRELTVLVNELVDLATDAHTAEPAVPVALRPLLERAADRLGRRTGRTVTVDADDTVVIARQHDLLRAVNNLVENAAKFDPGGQQPIEIDCRAATVHVSDRGPGVPDGEMEAIFDRFHRGAGSRGLPGSGLGLAIVRDVVARQGGRVRADPRPGGGLVVTIDLHRSP